MKKQLTVNGESIQSLSETLLNFLNEINLNYNKNIAIAVNEEIVEKNNWKNYKLKPGDKIEIVEPLKGG